MSGSALAEKRIALITGANKGIGFEIARGLCAQGLQVIIGCRDGKRAEAAVCRLAELGCAASCVLLDVTKEHSISAVAEEIGSRYRRLDVLVNNAGISAEGRAKPSVVELSLVKRVYETNVFGAMAMIQAMLPLLLRSDSARIVNLSSSLGSLALASDQNSHWSRFTLLGYNSSKTALNAVTVQFANELRESNIKVNSVCPGYVATDLNGNTGYRTPEQGAAIAIKLATLPKDGPTGGFFDDAGPIPW
jgi:NAD(P)-dependent dehydrogenase (short-subunit alcohol dehydrogenase family)